MIIRAMNKDFSWEKSAKEYLKLYKLAKKNYQTKHE
jgi:glycogen synthase